jgi:hypothetical protein
MATLSAQTLANMASYPLSPAKSPPYPAVNIVPATDTAPFRGAACWAWTLVGDPISGTMMDLGDFTTNLLDLGPTGTNFVGLTGRKPDGLVKTNMNCTRYAAEYAQIADLIAKQKPLQWSTTRRKAYQALFTKLVARGYGLAPTDDANADYTLHMGTKTSSWWSWDHWGIGVKLPGKRAIVQTVTGYALYQANQYMWGDDDMQTVVGLTGLTDTQTGYLNRIVKKS